MPVVSYYYALPYLLLFLCLLPFGCAVRTSPRSPRAAYARMNTLVFITVFVLFFAFRGYVFTDWSNYYGIFNAAPENIADIFQRYSYVEKGFLVLASVVKRVSGTYLFFQFVNSCIDAALILLFFKVHRGNENLLLFFAFYLLFNGINIEINLLRNSKAILLFLISLKYLEEKQFLPYALINGVGVMFHTSALIYLPLYFLINRRYNKWIILVIWTLGQMKYLLHISMLASFFHLISTLNINIRLFRLVDNYIMSGKGTAEFGLSIGYIERFLSFVLIFLMRDRLIKKDRRMLIYTNAFFLYAISYLYLAEISVLVTSFTNRLLTFSYWLVYPNVFLCLRNKANKAAFMIILALYGTLKLSNSNTLTHRYDNFLLNPSINMKEARSNLDRGIRYMEQGEGR